MNERKYYIAKLTRSSELVVFVTRYKVKNVTLQSLISLKNPDRPLIGYIVNEFCVYENVSEMCPYDFIITFTKAYSNTITSGLFNLHGHNVAIDRSLSSVFDDIVSYSSTLSRVSSIDFLKQLQVSGFTCPNTNLLLDSLLEAEASERMCNKKAKLIQSSFKKAISDPTHMLCVRRLLREFAEFQDSVHIV